jgi:hypothetical protein
MSITSLYDCLFVKNSEFMWTGDLSQLKVLVKDELNLTGQWSSPGGDVNTATRLNYQRSSPCPWI